MCYWKITSWEVKDKLPFPLSHVNIGMKNITALTDKKARKFCSGDNLPWVPFFLAGQQVIFRLYKRLGFQIIIISIKNRIFRESRCTQMWRWYTVTALFWAGGSIVNRSTAKPSHSHATTQTPRQPKYPLYSASRKSCILRMFLRTFNFIMWVQTLKAPTTFATSKWILRIWTHANFWTCLFS